MWFEEKRAEEGVPEHRLPYQHSAHETGWRFVFFDLFLMMQAMWEIL
jgi:hypothetical protein